MERDLTCYGAILMTWLWASRTALEALVFFSVRYTLHSIQDVT